MQNLIPYVRQMVFAYILIQGWIVYPYEQCFFYPSAEVLVFPPHYAEFFHGNIMTSDVKVVIGGEGALRCSLNLSPNVLEDSPMYSSSHSTLSHLYLCMTPLFSGWYLDLLEPLGGS